VLAVAAPVAGVAGIFGVRVAKPLCACGFEDPSAESARAIALLTDVFGRGTRQLVIVVSSPEGYRSHRARIVGEEIVGEEIVGEASFMRMSGLGLTLAVLADATLVRMVLMPAFVHLLGEWNWVGARLDDAASPTGRSAGHAGTAGHASGSPLNNVTPRPVLTK